MVWKAGVSFYQEMFLFVGLSLLWWITGGFMVAAMVVLGAPLLSMGGPFWLAPLLAIPAGPASAAMANAARRAARELHVDRSFYWEGFKTYWRQALALSAISMGILALMLLNFLFYLNLPAGLVRILAILWAYLILFWISVQIYLYPVLVGLKEPTLWGALRTATVLTFANPLFSILLLVLAIVLTALSIVIPILLLFAWPAVIILLGEHALLVFMERLGPGETGNNAENGAEE
jgi:uncharacterized membrane protein YesL